VDDGIFSVDKDYAAAGVLKFSWLSFGSLTTPFTLFSVRLCLPSSCFLLHRGKGNASRFSAQPNMHGHGYGSTLAPLFLAPAICI
jgi:hypothetical protein